MLRWHANPSYSGFPPTTSARSSFGIATSAGATASGRSAIGVLSPIEPVRQGQGDGLQDHCAGFGDEGVKEMRKVILMGLAIALCLAVSPPSARAQSAGTCSAIRNADGGQVVSITWMVGVARGISTNKAGGDGIVEWDY
jgi:hypothetical protein